MFAGVSVPLLLAIGLVSSPPAPDVAGPASADLRGRGVLLIVGDDAAQPYVQQVYDGFRDALATAPTRTVLFREFFDVVRFGDRPEYAAEFRGWIRQKYRDQKMDALVVTQQAAYELMAGGADSLNIPIVYGSLGPLPIVSLPMVSGVVLEDPLPNLLRLITIAVPETRRIALIRGSSAAERARDLPYLSDVRRGGLALQDLGGLAMEDILRRVATLQSDTVAILVGFQVDAAGRRFQSDQAVRLIAPASARPVFSINPADIGSGAAGGLIPGTRMLGEQLASAVLERIAGKPPQTVTIAAARHAAATFDGRELARWGIAEDRLPAGSTILFPQPSLWRDHRKTVITTLAVGATQTALIVAVLVQRQHRVRAQAALSDSYTRLRTLTGRLINAQEDERARIARNLHDDVGQRVASLSIALSGAKRMADASEPLRTQLTSLQQEASSLSTELRDLSHGLHPGVLEHVGLLEALRSRCDEFSRESGVSSRLDVSDHWRDVPDRMALCLYRVAQEALRNVAQHASAGNVVVSLDQRDGVISMRIVDDGRGFATTEKKAGLGLLSLNERVSLLGGALDISSKPAAGTTLMVTLPLDVSDAA